MLVCIGAVVTGSHAGEDGLSSGVALILLKSVCEVLVVVGCKTIVELSCLAQIKALRIGRDSIGDICAEG